MGIQVRWFGDSAEFRSYTVIIRFILNTDTKPYIIATNSTTQTQNQQEMNVAGLQDFMTSVLTKIDEVNDSLEGVNKRLDRLENLDELVNKRLDKLENLGDQSVALGNENLAINSHMCKNQYINNTCKYNTNHTAVDLRAASASARQIEGELLRKSVRAAGGVGKSQKRIKQQQKQNKKVLTEKELLQEVKKGLDQFMELNTPVETPDEPPVANVGNFGRKFGRAFSSDEDGDGPPIPTVADPTPEEVTDAVTGVMQDIIEEVSAPDSFEKGDSPSGDYVPEVATNPSLLEQVERIKDALQNILREPTNLVFAEEARDAVAKYNTLKEEDEAIRGNFARFEGDIPSESALTQMGEFMRGHIISAKYGKETQKRGHNFTGPGTDFEARMKGINLPSGDIVYGDGNPQNAEDRASWFHDKAFEDMKGLNRQQMLEMIRYANEQYILDMNRIIQEPTSTAEDKSSAEANILLFNLLNNLGKLGLDLVNYHGMEDAVDASAEDVDLDDLKLKYHNPEYLQGDEAERVIRMENTDIPRFTTPEDVTSFGLDNIRRLVNSDNVDTVHAAKNALASHICTHPHCYSNEAVRAAKNRVSQVLAEHAPDPASPYVNIIVNIKDRKDAHDAVTNTNSRQLFVKGIDGRTSTVSFGDGSTVTDIKDTVHMKTGISPQEQKLIFAGKVLQDGKSVADYNIQKESTLHLTLGLKGGSGTGDDYVAQDKDAALLSAPDATAVTPPASNKLKEAINKHIKTNYAGDNLENHRDYRTDYTLSSQGGLSADPIELGQLKEQDGTRFDTKSDVAIGGGFTYLPDQWPVVMDGVEHHKAYIKYVDAGWGANIVDEVELQCNQPLKEGANYVNMQTYIESSTGVDAFVKMSKMGEASGTSQVAIKDSFQETRALLNKETIEEGDDIRGSLRSCHTFIVPLVRALQLASTSAEGYSSFSQIVSNMHNSIPRLVNGQHVDNSAYADPTTHTVSGVALTQALPPLEPSGSKLKTAGTHPGAPNNRLRIEPLASGKPQLTLRIASMADFIHGMRYTSLSAFPDYPGTYYDDVGNALFDDFGSWHRQYWNTHGAKGIAIVPYSSDWGFSTSQLLLYCLWFMSSPFTKKVRDIPVSDSSGGGFMGEDDTELPENVKCTPVINWLAIRGAFRKILLVDCKKDSQKVDIGLNGTSVGVTSGLGTTTLIDAGRYNIREFETPNKGLTTTNDPYAHGRVCVVRSLGNTNQAMWHAAGAIASPTAPLPQIGHEFIHAGNPGTGGSGQIALKTQSFNVAEYFNDWIIGRQDMDTWQDLAVVFKAFLPFCTKSDIDQAAKFVSSQMQGFINPGKHVGPQSANIDKTATAGTGGARVGAGKSRLIGQFHIPNEGQHAVNPGTDGWSAWVSPPDCIGAVEMGSQPVTLETINGQPNPSVMYKLSTLTDARGVRLYPAGNISPPLQNGGLTVDSNARSIESRTSGNMLGKFDPVLLALMISGYITWGDASPMATPVYTDTLLNSGIGNINKQLVMNSNAMAAIFDTMYMAAGMPEGTVIGGRTVPGDFSLGISGEQGGNKNYRKVSETVRNIQRNIEYTMCMEHSHLGVRYGNDWLKRTNNKYIVLNHWAAGWDYTNKFWHAPSDPASHGRSAIQQICYDYGQNYMTDASGNDQNWIQHQVYQTTVYNRLHPKYLAHIFGREDNLPTDSSIHIEYPDKVPPSVTLSLAVDDNARPSTALTTVAGNLPMRHTPYIRDLPSEIGNFMKKYNQSDKLLQEQNYINGAGGFSIGWSAPYNAKTNAALPAAITKASLPPIFLTVAGQDVVSPENYPQSVNYVMSDVSKGIRLAGYRETSASVENNIITLNADVRDYTHPMIPGYQDFNDSRIFQLMLPSEYRSLFLRGGIVGNPITYTKVDVTNPDSSTFDGFSNNFNGAISAASSNDWGF